MDGNVMQDSAAEIEQLRRETNRFVGRRILIWAVRWVIGFAIIGAVTYFYEGLDWLWWGGLALAGTSLALMLAMHLVMSRKLASAQAQVDELDDILKNLKQD